MPGLICPVCSKPLFDCGASYKCPGGHCFDKARKGYVNLNLASGARSKRHGDDTVMVICGDEAMASTRSKWLVDIASKTTSEQ